MALALALPGSTHAAPLNEFKKLTASDGQPSDFFGYTVAISGDTAVVGARGEDAGGLNRAGAAYVFQRDEGGAGNWGEVRKLTSSDAESGDDFGFSVAVSGDTAVVGAWREDGAFRNNAGAAYIFQRDEGGVDNWGEVSKLTPSDPSSGNQFGNSVAVSGDTIVVGAFTGGSGGPDSGAAYVYRRNQGGADNWGEVKKLTASDTEAYDLFGRSVAVSGDTAFVGADWEDAAGNKAGAAYVFQRDEGGADNWGEVKKLTASDAGNDDLFGRSVGVSGDTAVVGAPFDDAIVVDFGSAYIFRRNQGGPDNWGEVKKLAASDAQFADDFGHSVAISGDGVVIGAISEDSGGNLAGAAYVFERDQGGVGSWGEVTKLMASDAEAFDSFGKVAISGDTAIVGASLEDTKGDYAGAAYIFEEPPLLPVGGFALDSDLRALQLETAESDSAPWILATAIVAVAGLLALGGAAWYARRRHA